MMLKFELKKIIRKRMNVLLFAAALILAVLFSVFAMKGVRYIEQNGDVHKGLDSTRLISAQKNKWKGTLTKEKLLEVVSENQAVKTQYSGEHGVPDDIYANKLQPSIDISQLINDMYTEEGEYNPYAIDSLNKEAAKNLYEIRQANIDQVIEQEAITSEQKDYLTDLYAKIKTPFYYEAADSFKAMTLLGEQYGLILVLLVGFISAGIFADEFQYKADAIFFSTKCGRKKAIHSKIQSGLIITTFIYWTCMALFSLICFGVMGVSGAKAPIQIEYCYSIYNFTYEQYYLVILVCGYIASLLSASITMLISAKLHTATIAACIPFVLFCVSPFLGRALPFHTFFNLTPDQLINICNNIKNIVVYQINGVVFTPIVFVMGVYTVLSLALLPVTYTVYHRYRLKG